MVTKNADLRRVAFNSMNRKNGQKLQQLLESKGYVRVFEEFSQWDGWYVSREHYEATR